MKNAGRFLIAMVVAVFFSALSVRAEIWTPLSFVTELNTGDRDLSAFPTADGKTLYFASDRDGSYIGGDSRNEIDIYVSQLIDDHWGPPQRLPYPLNVPHSWDDAPKLTLDGRYMYFESNRPGGYGYLDIYVAENINGVWQTPVNLGPAINSSADDGDPNISPDGKTLIFDSSRGGYYGGGGDIFQSTKVNGVWQPAVNLGPTINNAYRNDHPAVSYSGRYMFYSSNFNVFRTEKVNGVWQTPVNVTPINGSDYDVVNFFLECDNSIYMSRLSDSWEISRAQWLDPPLDNPCSKLIIPQGQWRVRVTLLSVDASIKSDIVIDQPISQLLIRNSLKNVGKVVTTPFISAEQLVFHLRVNAQSLGLGEYDHYSNSEFAIVQRVDPLRYIVNFEDLPADRADWDYNDVVLLVELVGEEVNIQESTNFLGESQIIVPAPLEQDADLFLPLAKGDGLMAQATVPATGLQESTYAIMIEGDTALYSDVLADAPFASTSVVLKLELTNGQDTTVNGEPFTMALDLLAWGDSATADNRRLYWFNPYPGSWEEVPDQSRPAPYQLAANTANVGLYAVGVPKGGSISIPVTCGLLGTAPASLAYLLVLLPALALRLAGRKKRA
jgi:hypothetical protein